MVGPPPPPPPPGPPPPPKFSVPSKTDAPPEARNALLQSIQKGAKLKKTVTNDKSGPAVAGRIGGTTSSSSSVSSTSNNGNNNNNSIGTGNARNDGPKLGGIFGGLSSMPKLKPVGTRGIPTTNRSPTQERANETPPPPPPIVENNNVSNERPPPLDFSSELAKTLTLKRQKKENSFQTNDVSNQETRTLPRTSIVNRGPPPQPPAVKKFSTSTSDSVLGKPNWNSHQNLSSSTTSLPGSNQSTNQGNKSPTTPRLLLKHSNGASSPLSLSPQIITPNISTLFNKTANSGNDNNVSNISNSYNKPTLNFGKPNLAPKPPGVDNRAIARHHSMKLQRSPPTVPINETINFTSANHLGTMRARPSIAPPPRPPLARPPPPPTRNIAQPNSPLNLGGSDGSLNSNNGTIKNNGTIDFQQPPPPHRTCPPPPTPRQQNQPSSNGPTPPPPPQRGSSKRGNNAMGKHHNISNAVSGIIIDLESKFSRNFHNVTEFPKPQPFLSINKSYPSHQNAKMVR